MPSKNSNGNQPLGRSIKVQGGNLQGSIAQIESKVAKLQPAQSLDAGMLQLPNGRVHVPKRAGAGATSTPCILGRVSKDSENSTDEITKYKINAGFLTGGGSTELIEPDNLTAKIDDFVWLKVLWTADVIDGVLQAGGTMGAVTIHTGTTIPDDTTPTVDSTSGIAYITLGGWVTDNVDAPDGPNPVWIKQGCGSIQLYFCPGQGFFFGRNNAVETGE